MLRSYVRKTLCLSSPLRTATRVWTERVVFIIRYEAAGVVGWGEAAPLEGWGGESEIECAEQLMRWVESGVLPTTPSASFGVDLAVLDHSARCADQPLWRFLGGQSHTVSCQETLGSISPQATLQRLGVAFDAGFRTAKLKVGADALRSDVERVLKVSQSFPDMKLRLDANGSWSVADAAEFVEATREVNIDFLEQPLEVGDVLGLVELRQLGVSVAADEGAVTRVMRTRLIEAGAVDAIIIKPSVLGTVSELRDEVSRISAAGVRVVFSSAIESAIGRNTVAHVVAGLGTAEPAGLNTGKWISDDLAPWVMRGADIILDGPGIGATLADLAEQIHRS